jgi:biopolymer transport protein ExbD
MAFGTHSDADDVMSEINMTPFVDVMLVLLIVFIVTVPVLQHTTKLNLPQASAALQTDSPKALRLTIDAQGQYLWNDSPVTDEQLRQNLQAAGQLGTVPQLHVLGDKAVRYERVAQAVAAAQSAGVRKIGFVSEPQR